jgi:hypothetical protein
MSGIDGDAACAYLRPSRLRHEQETTLCFYEDDRRTTKSCSRSHCNCLFLRPAEAYPKVRVLTRVLEIVHSEYRINYS